MKKKGLKSAGIVGLSAVLACGALGALAGCGGGNDPGNNPGATGSPLGDENTLTVSIFCNAADAMTNQAICDEWAAEYGPTIGKTIKVDLQTNTSKGDYYDQLNKLWSTGATTDIIYLAPRYVRAYAERGNILDLSGYLDADQLALTSDVWQNGISYYGYIKGDVYNYKMGRPITLKDGKFVTATNESTTGTSDEGREVGLYGLPKDYSNFSTGYNRNFFTDALKTAYQNTKPNAGGSSGASVKGPKGEGTNEFTSKLTYTHRTGYDNCITYAASGTNPVTNETFTAGQVANIINVGIPTTYKPYNFFRFATFREALTARDPVAVMSEAMGGYTVTIPGFPNDELKITDAAFKATYGNDANFDGIDVPYNKEIGHVTYTYAEYGALLWACTYYLNTFAWANGQSDHLNGTGGAYFSNDKENPYKTVYGGEQYEGANPDGSAAGSALYLLPWLASNDADLINDYSTFTSQTGRPNGGITEDIPDLATPSEWRTKAGHATYSSNKRTLADTVVARNVQFGHNSENFIETYAAFLAIGSDWNVNPSGDTEEDRTNNGWAYFRTGRSISYGAGSWDAATRNEVDQAVLDFGQMPTPIAEKYALYSEIKDANYQKATYANVPARAKAGSTDEAKQLTGTALENAKTKTYTADEILRNQIRRQDKWAARMDTVGYAVAGKVLNYPEAHQWKKDAAISLTARLTINKDAQKTLLYGGAQLPNFVSQCEDFVNYNTTAGESGSFSDMLTPEGFYDTDTPAHGKQIWDSYYEIVREMQTAYQTPSSPDRSKTVAEFLADKKDCDGNPIKYDAQYANVKLSEFTGATTGQERLAFGMKVLKMVTFRADDRDINIRMQYGLNSVRDSSMYTYKDDWMGAIDARTNTSIMAYLAKKPLTESMRSLLTNNSGVYSSTFIQMNPAQNTNPNGAGWTYMTPAVWCFKQTPAAQSLLNTALQKEIDNLPSNN